MNGSHKWCDIYQESLVAGRNYFRNILFLFILIVAYQSYTSGMKWWQAALGALLTWVLLRLGGRIVQSRHYDSAEQEWDSKDHSSLDEDQDEPQDGHDEATGVGTSGDAGHGSHREETQQD